MSSGLSSKADIAQCCRHVSKVLGADIQQRRGQCYNSFWCSPGLQPTSGTPIECTNSRFTNERDDASRCECKAPYPDGVKRNWRGVMPVQRLNAWVKELTSPYPNSHAISETGRSRSTR